MQSALLALVIAALSLLAPAAHADQPLVVKLSHVNTDNTPKGVAANRFKELATKYLGDRVRVEVYPNSTLFGDAQEMEALLLNDVQIIAPSLSKFERYTNKLQVFDLPFLFNDPEAVTRFQASEEGQKLLGSIKNRGYLGLGYIHNGMKQLSANRSIRMPDDAKGLRIRIQPSKVIEEQYHAVGARPQKLAFSEVYQALQTGVVEAQENSWTSMYTMKFFEVQPHITETNHGMMSFMVTVSARWWEGLPADLRNGLSRALDEASREANTLAEKMHQDNKNRIVASGRSEIITLTDEERKAWHQAMQPVWRKFEAPIGAQLIEAAQKANHGS